MSGCVNRSRGVDLMLVLFSTGLILDIKRLSRILSASLDLSEVPEERILKSDAEM
jgi:hypothetical protein